LTIEFYDSRQERGILISQAEQRDESLLHDDFVNINNNPTDGRSGRLEFGIVPNPDVTEFNRTKLLRQKLKDGIISQPELLELLDTLL